MDHTLGDCPHCDPEHTPPWNGTWSAHLAPGRDGDGQPITIHVGRPDGAHVAERDAQWVNDVLTAAAADHHRASHTLPDDERTARARDAAARAAQNVMALDLHQALGLPLNMAADHQGHTCFADWWAHLLHRARTASQRQTAPELADPPTAPEQGTDTTAPEHSLHMRARVLGAITAATADRKRLDLATREQIAQAVLTELGADLIDEDAAPALGEASVLCGELRLLWCVRCHTRSRYHMTSYITWEDTITPVGTTDVCGNCRYTPYQDLHAS
ncbi:hypothetical protein [Nocardiopsis synnemataformans]|uniref:hypothetical protein n=1 Tax=Nocardiopsis synnemataformans TaxID=61305 RepID=UPI003EC13D8F